VADERRYATARAGRGCRRRVVGGGSPSRRRPTTRRSRDRPARTRSPARRGTVGPPARSRRPLPRKSATPPGSSPIDVLLVPASRTNRYAFGRGLLAALTGSGNDVLLSDDVGEVAGVTAGTVRRTRVVLQGYRRAAVETAPPAGAAVPSPRDQGSTPSRVSPSRWRPRGGGGFTPARCSRRDRGAPALLTYDTALRALGGTRSRTATCPNKSVQLQPHTAQPAGETDSASCDAVRRSRADDSGS